MDLSYLPTLKDSPAFVCDLSLLRKNLELLKTVQEQADCKILLALKGFAMWSTFPIVREYLPGVTCSSVFEARLGKETFGGEVHAYAPAYSDQDIEEILPLVDHIVLNSVSQWRRHKDKILAAGVEAALRLNPEHSEVQVKLYDPCAEGSRLGIRVADLSASDLEGLSGLHFHTLCEMNSDALERTLAVFEKKFGHFVKQIKWVNFGGGHHITRPDYDVERLIRVIRDFKSRHQVQIYLEPGSAIALNTGVLVSTVLDIVPGSPYPTVILDTSATAHMPDVLEMPYRPRIFGGDDAGKQSHSYRLGGLTCLAGDVIGDWSFDHELQIGEQLVFDDMIHYTMVKTTMFNGVRHPSIATFDPQTKQLNVVRRFVYEDFRDRLS